MSEWSGGRGGGVAGWGSMHKAACYFQFPFVDAVNENRCFWSLLSRTTRNYQLKGVILIFFRGSFSIQVEPVFLFAHVRSPLP